MQGASHTIKRVTLELGGKSANVVFADADLETAAAAAPYAGFDNAGQDCCARSRILVEQSAYDRFAELLVAATRKLKVGDPEDDATEMGPLISAAHRENRRELRRGRAALPWRRAGRQGLLVPRDARRGGPATGSRARRSSARCGPDPVRGRGGGGADRERLRLRALRVDLDARRRLAPSASRARSRRASSRSTRTRRASLNAVRRLQAERAFGRELGNARHAGLQRDQETCFYSTT